MTDMRAIRVEKVVVNIGVGEAGEKLVMAQRFHDIETRQKSTQTLAHVGVRDWGVRRNMPIGAKVTLRGSAADAFLERALAVRNNRLPAYSFDPRGNFSFGVPDYTDFEGMKYDPEIGVFGMDVTVSLSRPGFRVARRRVRPRPVPMHHRITRSEGIEFIRSRFKTEVIE